MRLNIRKTDVATFVQYKKILSSIGAENIVLSFREHGPFDMDPVRFADELIASLDKGSTVEIENLPYCVTPTDPEERTVMTDVSGYRGEECLRCRYKNDCCGLLSDDRDWAGTYRLSAIEDRPVELMIEAESDCNLGCEFCFNHATFARAGRTKVNLASEDIRKAIDVAGNMGIGIIRFTGGEPLLRDDMFELMEYAKAGGFEVRLNTNATGIDEKKAGKIVRLADDVLIPLHSGAVEDEDRITGGRGVLKDKERGIFNLKDAGADKIRLGTVATKKNIKELEAIEELISAWPIYAHEYYRPISVSSSVKTINFKDVGKLVYKINALKRETAYDLFIANALPFCAIDEPGDLAQICKGALFDDGHSRMVIDPRGFIKPHYFYDIDLAPATRPDLAWESEFMRDMRYMRMVPLECSNCRYLMLCRSGSRHEAFVRSGEYAAPDPLTNYNNKIKIKL